MLTFNGRPIVVFATVVGVTSTVILGATAVRHAWQRSTWRGVDKAGAVSLDTKEWCAWSR